MKTKKIISMLFVFVLMLSVGVFAPAATAQDSEEYVSAVSEEITVSSETEILDEIAVSDELLEEEQHETATVDDEQIVEQEQQASSALAFAAPISTEVSLPKPSSKAGDVLYTKRDIYNVRVAAEASSANVFYAYYGDKLEIIGYDYDSKNRVWYKIKSSANAALEGYVLGTDFTKSFVKPDGRTAYAVTAGAGLYTTAAKNENNCLKTFTMGETMKVLTQSGNWFVVYYDGVAGFVDRKDITFKYISPPAFDAVVGDILYSRVAIAEAKDSVDGNDTVFSVFYSKAVKVMGVYKDSANRVWYEVKDDVDQLVYVLGADFTKDIVKPDGRTAYAVTTGIFLRATPEGEQLNRLWRGNTMTIITQAGDWFMVNYQSEIGFVKRNEITFKYTAPLPTPAAREGDTLYSKQAISLVRNNLNGDVLFSVLYGDAVTVTGYEYDNSNRVWYLVKNKSGDEGWGLGADFTKDIVKLDGRTAYAVTAGAGVYYTTTKDESNRFKSLVAGETMTAITQSGNWFMVSIDGTIGFVDRKDITFTLAQKGKYANAWGTVEEMQADLAKEAEKMGIIWDSGLNKNNGSYSTPLGTNGYTSPSACRTAAIEEMRFWKEVYGYEYMNVIFEVDKIYGDFYQMYFIY